MNKVDFLGHKFSRLIIGDNPMTGHSYIEDTVPGVEMKGYYSDENVQRAFSRLEEVGFTGMLPLAQDYMISQHKEHEARGGKLKLIWQYHFSNTISVTDVKGTIGAYIGGGVVDYLYEKGEIATIKENLEKIRSLGIHVGLGTHYPEVIKRADEENWGAEFYLACVHQARRGRVGEQSGFITGKTKSGIIFYPEDRPVMLDTISKTDKPVIAFKIFAGGQMFLGKTEEQKRALIKGVYDEVFTALKPNDMAAIGVFQRDKDEIKEDYDLYMEWYREKHGVEAE